MNKLENIIESEKRMNEIRRYVKDASISMTTLQEQILMNICHLFIEYADWMYEIGKEVERKSNTKEKI